MFKKSYILFILICILFLFDINGDQKSLDALQPIKKIYLKYDEEQDYFCMDFIDGITFSPIIYTLPKGVKLILTFSKKIALPANKFFRNHKIINGYFFERVGDSSVMMILSLKNEVTFTEKKYTKSHIKLGFRVKQKRTVVIDAGHGGKDPGSMGIDGDFEKNITLVAAIELRNKLIASGRYNVILTRDRDQFIPIDERKMNLHGADLLISLHTDSNSDKGIHGMSIYTLPTVDFLKNKSQISNEKVNNYHKRLSFSRKFANIVMKYMPKDCKFEKHPQRDVELKILKLPFPAVLIELGCISNKIDSQLLHSKEFREKTNRAILYALDEFFEKEQVSRK